jgi:CSLREA domain-containing protein
MFDAASALRGGRASAMCVLTPPTRTGFRAVNVFQGGNHEKSKQKKAGRDRARVERVGCLRRSDREGVVIGQPGTGNAILGNSIHSNIDLGIALGGDGVTPNDPGDVDTGPNKLQNFPVLTKAQDAAGVTSVQGTFNSRPNDQFRIEFFSSPSCDDSGNGEGKKFAGFTNVMTDASGNAPLSIDIASALFDGPYITATAIDSLNNTSEFLNCVPALGFIFTVNSTTDTDDGFCTLPPGGCTLREAINYANRR